MQKGNILLGVLLFLFSGALVLTVALAPDLGPQTLEVIDVDMGKGDLESTRNIPRPRPRQNKVKPVREETVKALESPSPEPPPEKTIQKASRAPSADSSAGMEVPSVPEAGEGAATSASQAAAGFMDRADYLELLKMRVGAFKKYPQKARSQGRQGRAKVRFTINKSGEVKEVRIIASSGHKALDKAAVDAVHRAAPFPSTPGGMFDYPLSLQVEVSFELT
ncbi:MAG: energy transducer TonB [Desulfonatronovibrionaceae bacterium]